VNTALDIALADIGAWGLGLIAAGTFLAHRSIDRARLVNPSKVPAQDKDSQDKAAPGDAEPRVPALGGLSSIAEAAR